MAFMILKKLDNPSSIMLWVIRLSFKPWLIISFILVIDKLNLRVYNSPTVAHHKHVFLYQVSIVSITPSF